MTPQESALLDALESTRRELQELRDATGIIAWSDDIRLSAKFAAERNAAIAERDALKATCERQALRITHLVMERRGGGVFADAAERLAVIANEHFGPFPLQTFNENLVAIEHGARVLKAALTEACSIAERAADDVDEAPMWRLAELLRLT